jgi:PKD repeat protein
MLKRVLTILALGISLLSNAQTDTLFWFATPLSTRHHSVRSVDITITATETNSLTTVELYHTNDLTTPIRTATIDPSVSLTTNFNFTAAQAHALASYTINTVTKEGLLLRTSNKVTAYFEFSRGHNNPDILSLKGSNALGLDFWVPFQDRWWNQDYSSNLPAEPAMSQISIIATENNTKVTITTKIDAHGFTANTPSTITLQKGETFRVVPVLDPTDDNMPSRDPAFRLKGTHITSDKAIAVTMGDDSVIKNGWDYIGDQLVPIRNMKGKPLVGDEYIVLRGENSEVDANNTEKAYVLCTQNNTYLTIDGAAPVGPFNAGHQYVINIPDGKEVTHIKSAGKPVYVLHISGFIGEMGGAILPSITGCTGSLSVSFVRSSSHDIYLNIMVKSNAKDSLYLEKEDGTVVKIPGSYFDPISGSGWHSLQDNATVNAFFETHTEHTKVTRIYNTYNVFHLGIINETNGGCLYGYFSNYNEIESEIGVSDQGNFYLGCDIDSVRLYASGGISYQWSPENMVDDPTSATPMSYPKKGLSLFSVKVARPCKMDTVMNVVVISEDSPYSFFSLSDNFGCSELDVLLRNGTSNSSINVDWGDGSPVFVSGGPFDTIGHTYTNTSDTVIQHVITFTVNDLCPSSYTDTVRVYPQIDAAMSLMDPGDAMGCHPHTVEFDNATTGHTDRWEWRFGDGTSSFDSIPVHTFENFGTDDTTYRVNFKAISPHPYNCTSTDFVDITVHPYIYVNFGADTITRCSPFQINIKNSSSQVDLYNLDFGDGNDTTFNSFSSLHHTYINVDTVIRVDTLMLIGRNFEGCSDTAFKSITIFPQITAGFTASAYEMCDSVWVDFTDLSNGHDFDYLWEFGDGNSTTVTDPGHLYRNTTDHDTNYIVTLRIESPYCTDVAYDTINVHNIVNAGFTFTTLQECTPKVIEIDPRNTKGDTLYWDFDGDYVVDSIVFNHNTFQKTFFNTHASDDIHQNIRLITSNYGCSDSLIRPLTIKPQVVPIIDNVSATSGCSPIDISFGNLSKGGDLDYYWEFGDGTTSSDSIPAIHNFNNTTKNDKQYTVKLIATHPQTKCAAADSVILDIYPLVSAGFAQSIADICSPLEVQFTNTSTKITNESYTWDMGDGNNYTSLDVAHTYQNNTQNTILERPVKLTAYNSAHPACFSFFYDTVTVFPKVVSSFTPDVTSGCNPVTVNFAQNANGFGLDYNWDFADGNTSAVLNPVYTFQNVGKDTKIFNVALEVTDSNKCKNDTVIQITVYPYLEAGFTTDITGTCTPFQVNLTNTSTKATGESYKWELGDGFQSANENISHIYQNNSVNTIVEFPILLKTYLPGSGCDTSFAFDTLTVYPQVVADYAPDVLGGCHPLDVNFTGQSRGVGLAYYWEFGDGHTSNLADPVKVFENFQKNNKVFDVKLTVTDELDCADDTTIQITTYPFVNAGFSVGFSELCTPFVTQFTNNSTKATGEVYQWNLGDGTAPVSTDVTHTYQNNTKSTIQHFPVELKAFLAAHPECRDSVFDTVTVYPKVVADFNPDKLVGCHPFTVNFTENSNGVGLTYQWDFDNGTGSTQASPSNTFENFSALDHTYGIRLTVTDVQDCADDTVIQVVAHPFVEALFSYEKLSECTPFNVALDAKNSKSNRFAWDYDGDGSIEDTKNSKAVFNHLYDNTLPNSSVKVYPTLITYYDFAPGCTDTVSASLTIPPRIVSDFSTDKDSGCQPLGVSFTNLSTGGALDFNWEFGDTTTSSVLDPSHTYINFRNTDITFPVTLTVIGQSGCTDVQTKNITVYSYVESDFKVADAAKCSPFDVDITNSSRGGISQYRWDFSGEGNYTAQQPQHTFINTTGAITKPVIELEVSNIHGCSHSSTYQLIVYPQVEPEYDVTIEGCHPLTVTFANTTLYARDYNWEFGDGSTSLDKNPVHVFTNFDRLIDSTYMVKLTALSAYECVSSKDTVITVFPKPIALFDVSDAVNCPPFDVTFTNKSKGKQLSHAWDFADGQTGNTASPNHTFENNNSQIAQFDVTLLTTTIDGCTDTVSKMIRVYPKVTADFNSDIVEGCNPLIVSFNNQSKNQDYVEWDFDNGLFSSVTDPKHRFVNVQNADRVFEVTLTSRSDYNCFAEITKNITVFPSPSVEFSVEPTHQVYVPQPDVSLTNWSDHLDTWEFSWDFGDGSTSDNASREFEKEYTIWGDVDNDSEIPITLRAVNPNHPQCAAEKTHIIRIIPPSPEIEIKGAEPKGCIPLTVDFSTEYNYVHPDGFSWDFDDGNTSTKAGPVHTFTKPGIYNVKLEVKGDGGSSYDYKTVTAYRLPEVDFELAPDVLLIPSMNEPDDTLKLYNLSKYGKNYLWDFGDGNTSTNYEPSHVYDPEMHPRPPYKYDIKLVVATEHGCLDSLTKFEAVTIDGLGVIVFPNAFTPDPNGPSGGAYNLNDPDNTVFHPYSDGVSEYHLEIYTRWGEIIFSTDDKDIGWDGYFKGNLVNQGVYIWKVWGRFTNNREFVKWGDVTVLHNSQEVYE